MSLRLRLALLLTAVISTTVFLAWGIAGRAVIAPFAREVLDVYLDQAVFVADRVEAGESVEALERQLKLEIRKSDAPPRAVVRRLERDRPRDRCTREERGGHEVIWCRGPLAPVSVRTDSGWITLRRALDVGAPRERVGRFLLLLLVAMIGGAIWVAVLATRPLRATREAMAKIAAGDLQHRLPEEGAKELRDAAVAFNRMAERVMSMLETERRLMAGISHELRTPLARLRLELEILRDGGPPAAKRLDAMEGDLAEIDRLIGELLESSRLSIGDRSLSRGPIDLRQIVEEAAHRPTLAGRKIEISGEPAPAEGDRDRLIRVVANLLDNAAKYAPPELPIEVTLMGRSVEVADRGPGVPAAELPKLFEPFYRGSAAKPGLGLGLMIAQQVITLHGGRIEARNRDGGGLSVKFELPESTKP
ncbi:MAG: HAMP domain-containing histidine kinase [Deltaproteobacteria bacterium]|nr:HAMP domain-containing histidine kinase [Deltaproteobacteria bacterium]